MIKVFLNIHYLEKDYVKCMAFNLGFRVRWDRRLKKWYWQGEADKFPEFLQKYLPEAGKVGEVEELNEKETEQVEILFHLKPERKPKRRILQAVAVGDGFEFRPRKKGDDEEDD